MDSAPQLRSIAARFTTFDVLALLDLRVEFFHIPNLGATFFQKPLKMALFRDLFVIEKYKNFVFGYSRQFAGGRFFAG